MSNTIHLTLQEEGNTPLCYINGRSLDGEIVCVSDHPDKVEGKRRPWMARVIFLTC